MSPLEPEVGLPTTPPVFHVWVNLGNQANHESAEYPGLVLHWRQARAQWEAFTTYVVINGDHRTVISTWVEARCLKPVRSR
jgi:hypothetical protein